MNRHERRKAVAQALTEAKNQRKLSKSWNTGFTHIIQAGPLNDTQLWVLNGMMKQMFKDGDYLARMTTEGLELAFANQTLHDNFKLILDSIPDAIEDDFDTEEVEDGGTTS